MKTTLAFLFLGLAALSANAQWQPAARLTNSLGNSTTYANSNRCIAASGNAVHAVWNDMRNGDNDIFYKRSLDGGVTWEADVALVTNTEFQNLPSIAVSGSTVHLVWEDTRDGGSEIYYKRSNDAGVNWTDDTKISLQGSNLGMPSIASEGDNVHAVWLETSASFVEDVYHIASVDGGVTWGMETALSTQESDEVQPTVAVSGNFVHVAWEDHRFYTGADWNDEIYYIRSADGGATWGTEVRVSNNEEESLFPTIAASGANVHIAWQDDRTGVMEVFTRSSTDNGTMWGTETQVTSSAFIPSQLPSVAANGADVHLVWSTLNMSSISIDLYYAKSTDAGASWSAIQAVDEHQGSSTSPHIAVSGSRVHVLWQDDREVSGEPYDIEIYYTNNDNTSGIENINANAFSLYPNPTNNTLVIGSNETTANETYTVTDHLGRVVMQGKLTSNEISVNALANGLYMLRIGNLTKAFAVQHH